ncbi:MAG: hypothetical protein KDA24_27215 [Deltaproteobacteria bacterium]|nr:hypothetical protein [Deltaproteobacteria bacterium]
MTKDPASIAPIADAARRAVRSWKLQRSAIGGMLGLLVALHAVAFWAVWREFMAEAGLTVGALLTGLSFLLLVPLGALVGWLRPLPVARAAHELDLRAGLDDRLSTALEFAGDDTAMARMQRVDAISVANVNVPPFFPVPWQRGAPWLLAALLLCLVCVGGALTFELGLHAPEPIAESLAPADDLLEAIQSEKERLLEAGDKAGARILDDMAREVRKIQVRREELKRRIAERRAAEPPPPPASEEPQIELPPPSAGSKKSEKRGDLITAEDLEALEADMVEGLEMTEAQMGDLTSQLFSSTRAAKKLNEEFHHHVEHEMDVTMNAQNTSQWGTGQSQAGKTQERMDGMDMLGQGAQSDRLSSMGDVESQGNDMITRDLSAESQAAHDSAHDQQHSFNEFLKDFVKDMQGTVAEAAMGKKAKKKSKEVQVSGPQAMADKKDAMAESGFEEVGDMKRSSGDGPPEEPMGGESSAPGDGAGEPGDGPPPDDLSNLKSSEGSPGEDAIAIKAESGGGQTSAGASGAGTGDPNAEGGRSGHLAGLSQLSGPLDEVLGKLGEGSLPTEERKQLFDRLARHKVQAGLASEADDVLLDYFAQAEELIADEEQLSPLFRDFATLYFDSIRPGHASRTSSAGPADEPPRSSTEPAGPDARSVP